MGIVTNRRNLEIDQNLSPNYPALITS